jgi:hypothetical protein
MRLRAPIWAKMGLACYTSQSLRGNQREEDKRCRGARQLGFIRANVALIHSVIHRDTNQRPIGRNDGGSPIDCARDADDDS